MSSRDDGQPIFGSWQAKGMLHGSTIRSDISRGRLIALHPPALPRGYRLVQASDIPGSNRIKSFGAQIPVFASESISYRGEALGLVVGPDPALADQYAASVRIETDEEEPFLQWESFESSQIVARKTAIQGDPDSAFSGAARTDRGTYGNRSAEHYYSEPMGAAAYWDYDTMAILCASQWPYHVRDSVALALGSDPADVVVRPARLGMHLDGKLWYPSLLACQAAVAARVCGTPVRIFYTRKEDFYFSPKRARSQISMRSALDAEGRLVALDIRLVINVGAYAPLAEEILGQAMLVATGIYACPNIRMEGFAVSSNTVPMGALGGLGASHAYFAIESHANRIAQATGENPADWKANNLLRKGARLFGSSPVAEDVPYARILKALEGMSDYRRKYASYELVRKRNPGPGGAAVRGISLALAGEAGIFFLQAGGSNTYSLEATLDKESRLELNTSAAAEAPDVIDLWRATAAEILGLDVADVRVAGADTRTSPNSGPITTSRGVTVMNRLVERCCKAIQRRRFREALPLAARSVIRVSNHVRWEEGSLEGVPFESTAWGGAVVEVEIDPSTGSVSPAGVWMVADSGRIPHGDRAVGLLRSAIVDALGICMGEAFDPAGSEGAGEGYFTSLSPPLSSLPEIKVALLEPDGRSKPKGVDDLPFDTIPPAFLGAVAQATGGEPGSLPLSCGDILSLLEVR